MTGRASFSVQPDYIFELDYQNTSSKKFAEYAEKYNVKLGYHGSRMDNFHSILHNGLQVHMTKVVFSTIQLKLYLRRHLFILVICLLLCY